MKISVIITTKNEERNIANCLESVKRQDFDQSEIEIIVVDNNSEDNTQEVATRYTDLVFDGGSERSAQRNLGIKKSSGSYFIFLDADMIMSKNVLSQCIEKVKKDSDLVALYVPEIILDGSFFGEVRNFERSFYNNTVIDGVRFIKKDVFEKIGGFDEKLYAAEDWDLTKRIKKFGQTEIIEAPIFHNESRSGLKIFLAKKRYYGKNLDLYISKWGKKDKDIKKQFGIYYRFLGVFLENGKWKKFLAHPILAAGVYGIKTLVGIVFIFREKS